MKRFTLYIFCLAVLLLTDLKAQEKTNTIEQFIADIFEQYAAETDESLDFESFYEELMELSNNPLNLNKATKEELDRLPFLTDIQVENILFYIYRFGNFQTVYELQLVDGLDMTDIRRMLPFIYVGNSEIKSQKIYGKEIFKYGKNQILFRVDRGLETKAGYLKTDENSTQYLGSAFYNSLKYQFRFKERIKFGFTMEKDAGEQFSGSSHTGYDFYSFHAQLNDMGKFKTIVAGDFRANYGQGLVLGPGFGMGKSSYVLKVNSYGTGLKKYSSTNESIFFRGAGATMHFGKFDFSVFYSNKNIDGDTLNGNFASVYKTGLHRTSAEFKKKNTVNEQVEGFNTSFTHTNLQLGFTIVHTALNHNLEPDPATYNHFYFKGDKQTTGGLNYRFRLSKFNFFGETALTNHYAPATVNGITFSPLSQVSFVVLNRYFSPGYDTFYATAFSESSRINNESGFYLGAEMRPFKKWKIAAYADSYRFPWPKFGVDAPSVGRDYLMQIDYVARRDLTMFWRFKYEEKQDNESDSGQTTPLVVPLQKGSIRYQLNYSFENFSFRNILDGNLVQKNHSGMKYGLSALQDVSYSFTSIPLKIDFRYQFFDAVDYDNRFYVYERDILYAFSIPMYYGKGSRYYINMKYDLNDRISMWLKLAQTVYADDRETISSGNEEIQGNRRSDVRFMLRCQF